MAKIKIPVSKKAAEEAASHGDYELAKPGLYVCEVKEMESGFSKSENGKPDKTRQRLQVVLLPKGEGRENNKLDQQYGNLWHYVSFSDDAEWQRAELMHALGKSVKGQGFDVETDPSKPGTDIGKLVLARVKSDTDQQGNYKPRVGRLLPFAEIEPDDDDEEFDEEEDDEEEEEKSVKKSKAKSKQVEPDEEEDDEEEEEEDEDEDVEPDDDEEDDEDDESDEDEDEGYTKAELKKMSEKSLKKVAKELDLNPAKYKTTEKLIKAILKEQETPFD